MKEAFPGVGPPEAAAAPSSREFVVHADRSGGDGLGVGIERGIDRLIIKYVKDGAVQAWNRENPAKSVEAGDAIVAIDGVAGDVHLLVQECKKLKPLALTIRREGAAKPAGAEPAPTGRGDGKTGGEEEQAEQAAREGERRSREEAKEEEEEEAREAKEKEEGREAREAEDRERKRKTLELASGDVDGVDPDRVQRAKEQAEALDNTSRSQKDAIVQSMAKRLTIVQGPPGTGKTHTSVRIVTMWVKTMGYKPLLVTSECNIAVDNIAEGLVRNGVNVVRVGRPSKVRPELERATMANLIKEKRRERREAKEEASESEPEEVGEEPEDWRSAEWREWERRRKDFSRHRQMERQQNNFARDRILREAEVIAATTIASGSNQLAGFSFHGILIDEVAQATETSAIVPIVCRGAEQLVLCGDHCQLPPSVQSRDAELRGYSLSLYSRLVEAGVPFSFLDTQYRAHPMLMEFSAECIYGGKLRSGIDGSERPQPRGIDWPSPLCPAAFFECSVEEHLEGESKANEAEARVVLELVRGVLEAGDLSAEDIGVVTPYKGQVRTLRRVLQQGLGEQVTGLEMASVDNFQGREKELIIFTAVRCNKIGSVGFLNDWRRLNVMITRARRGLVVVGCSRTLCYDPHWKLWLQFTERQGGCSAGTVKRAEEAAQALPGKGGKGKGKGKGKEWHAKSAASDGKGGAGAGAEGKAAKEGLAPSVPSATPAVPAAPTAPATPAVERKASGPCAPETPLTSQPSPGTAKRQKVGPEAGRAETQAGRPKRVIDVVRARLAEVNGEWVVPEAQPRSSGEALLKKRRSEAGPSS